MQLVHDETSAAGSRQQLRQTLLELRLLQMQRVEAERTDLHEFFGAEAEDLATFTLTVSVADLLMAQRSLPGLLPDWSKLREVTYDRYMPALLEKHAVMIAPKTYDFVLRDGRQFWIASDGQERLTLDLEVDDDPTYPFSQVRFSVPRRRQAWLHELIAKVQTWIDEHHFLRGQAFDALGALLEFDTPVAWDDVLLPAAVRGAIERNCLELLRHAPLYQANGLPLKRGIILHGPPGTGKTMIGRVLAQQAGATFIYVTPGMLENPTIIRRVFDWGRRFAPSILFFEDFDLVARERGNESREMLGEFLTCLDGIEGSQGLIAIATTNDLKAIEPALKDRPNRFDVVLEVPALDGPLRRRFIERWLADRPRTLELGEIVARTDGFTGAQIQEVCRQAAFAAVEEQVAQGETRAVRLELHQRHFAVAFERVHVRPRRTLGFHAAFEAESA